MYKQIKKTKRHTCLTKNVMQKKHDHDLGFYNSRLKSIDSRVIQCNNTDEEIEEKYNSDKGHMNKIQKAVITDIVAIDGWHLEGGM